MEAAEGLFPSLSGNEADEHKTVRFPFRVSCSLSFTSHKISDILNGSISSRIDGPVRLAALVAFVGGPSYS